MDIEEKTYKLVMIWLSQLHRDNIVSFVSIMLENEQSEKKHVIIIHF
jgi:hypothetical protein